MDATEQFVQKTRASLDDGTFVRLQFTLKGTAPADPRKIVGRLISIRGQPRVMMTFRYDKRDVIRNIPVADIGETIRHHLASTSSVLLGTTKRDWQLVLTDGEPPRLASHKAAAPAPPPQSHDRPKHSWLDASARPWLEGLGLVDPEGRVRASMADKHRQIERYLEILSHLISDCRFDRSDNSSAQSPLAVADMGCGKGHLTFAVWHLLRRVLKRSARITGIDIRGDLVESSNQLASRIGADHLSFATGGISNLPFAQLDILIALHACNTATDDAIRRGIELGASLILVAPCCHQEIRPQLGRPEPLAAILDQGVMAERMAEWVTDGLRALHLEWAGYRTKLIEFVASEHTPKNLLIAGVRCEPPFTDPLRRERIEAMKQFYGIRHQTLDPLLLESSDAASAARARNESEGS